MNVYETEGQVFRELRYVRILPDEEQAAIGYMQECIRRLEEGERLHQSQRILIQLAKYLDSVSGQDCWE